MKFPSSLLAAAIIIAASCIIEFACPTPAWAASPESSAVNLYIIAGLAGLLTLAALFVLLFMLPRCRRQVTEIEQKLELVHTKLQESEQAREQMSKTDPLTGINNRRRIDEFLDEQLDRAKRYKRPFSVIMVDIDGFRKVNESLGHYKGDQILLSFAVVLDNRSRTSDLVGRWAGEEFLIICPETSIKGAVQKVDNLRSILSECVFGVDRRITASYGITQFMPEDSIRTLMHRAEQALSRAKSCGRDQVACLPELSLN